MEEDRGPQCDDAQLIRAGEPGFPPDLRGLAPSVGSIYIRGKLPSPPRVAVVGARRCDTYGLETAKQMGIGLANAGVAVVSGGAAGVDTAVLEGCLQAGGAPVAVLGTGLDVAYPAANRALFARVARSGALVSEYPAGTPGRPGHFPLRNRLISALADGVVVVRAALHSGSLITARHAVRQGRRVMAVPGLAGQELSAGGHLLLRRGALLVERAEDVLAALGLSSPEQTRLDLGPGSRRERGSLVEAALEGMDAEARRILDRLGSEPRTVDGIVALTEMPSAKVVSLLLQLELSGLVTRRPGMKYTRTT